MSKILKDAVAGFIILSALIANLQNAGFAKEKQDESNWYYGLGIGTGAGAKFTMNNADISFTEWLKGADPINALFTMNFKAGWKFNRNLWLGFDGTLAEQGGKFGSTDVKIQITNYLAMLTYYPTGKGLLLRGGAGLSNLTQQAISGTTIVEGQKNGYGVLGGIGYAFEVQNNFNITVNVDYTRQFYPEGTNKLTASQFGILYVGFDWY